MTLSCEDVSVAELHIGSDSGASPGNNMYVYARRNKQWQEQIICSWTNFCSCDWDTAHPAPGGWNNATLRHWVDLPAGVNIIQSKGYRFGKGGVQTTLEVAVWRKECPAQEVVISNVVCIPPETIQEQGLCEFERLAALYGAMVGCITNTLSTPCYQGPDVCQSGYGCASACSEDGCLLLAADKPSGANPMGGQLLNSITLNYPYETRVRIDWDTAFLQNDIIDCPEGGCETGACAENVTTADECLLPPVA